jgi:hypothetical protein
MRDPAYEPYLPRAPGAWVIRMISAVACALLVVAKFRELLFPHSRMNPASPAAPGRVMVAWRGPVEKRPVGNLARRRVSRFRVVHDIRLSSILSKSPDARRVERQGSTGGAAWPLSSARSRPVGYAGALGVGGSPASGRDAGEAHRRGLQVADKPSPAIRTSA